MRRKDQEIRDKSTIESIIRKEMVCRIGLSENNMPYIVPMNFGYKDNFLYLHSAKEGKKIDIIKINNNVCFEIDTDHELIKSEKACSWGMKYRSIIGSGKAHLIDDYEEKRRALDIIMEHYSDRSSYNYLDEEIINVVIIKIEIESITGKELGYSEKQIT